MASRTASPDSAWGGKGGMPHALLASADPNEAPLAAAPPLCGSRAWAYFTRVAGCLLALMAMTTRVGGEEIHAWRSGTYNVTPLYNGFLGGDVWLGKIESRGNARGYLVFDLGQLDLAGKAIVEAALRIQVIHYISHDTAVTFGIYDVSAVPPMNPPPAKAQCQAIYEDLGSGTCYGSATTVLGHWDEPFAVSLASAALHDIASACGGDFAVGLARPTFPEDGYSNNYVAIGPGSNVTPPYPDYVAALNLTLASVPVAHAGGPYSFYAGESIVLDASNSADVDNDIASYLWDLNDDGTFETDAGEQAAYFADYAYLQSLGLGVGTSHDIHVQVTDRWGLSDTAKSTLTILPEPASISLLAVGALLALGRRHKTAPAEMADSCGGVARLTH